MKKRDLKKLLLLALTWCPLAIHPCAMWFKNDSNQQVLLVAEDGHEGALVRKNKVKQFGDPHQHTKFTVMTKSSQRSNFQRRFKIIQNSCSASHKIELNFSNLEKNDFDSNILSIEKYEPVKTAHAHDKNNRQH